LEKRTLLCFGDSNTHGTIGLRHPNDRRRYDRNTRWPGQLAKRLGDAWHVIEEGHPSRTSVHDDPVEGEHKNGNRILPALLESHRPIDLVVVMIGTNDLKMRYNVPPLDVAISVERLLATVAASMCGPDQSAPRALLVSPAPIREIGFLAEIFDGGADKSRKLAGYLSTIADRHGAGFFDAGSVAEVDPVDGIHLTAAGHGALAEALAGAVSAAFET